MANVAGGGGGNSGFGDIWGDIQRTVRKTFPSQPKTQAPRIGAQLGVGFDMAAWRRREEERKRREEEERRRQQEIRDQQNQEEEYARWMQQLAPTLQADAPTSAYKARVEQMRATSLTELKERQLAARDPLTEFYQLQGKMGKQAVGERLASVADMWTIRNPEYPGDAVIWNLVKSPFALDEVKNMVDEAHNILYSGDARLGRQMSIDSLKVWMRDRGVDERDGIWSAMDSLFRIQEKMEMPTDWVTGVLLLSLLIPNPISAGAAAGRIAATAGRIIRMAKLGGKFTTVMQGIGAAGEVVEERRVKSIAERYAQGGLATDVIYGTTPAQQAGVPGFNPLELTAKFQYPSVYQNISAIRRGITNISQVATREDVTALQNDFLTAWKKEGNPVVKTLKATGQMTLDWQAAIVDDAKGQVRNIMLHQEEAVRAGDAPYWAPINGDPDSSEWPVWLADKQKRENMAAAAAAANPARFAFYETAGWPRNAREADALWTRLRSQGIPQTIYGGFIKVAEQLGGWWQATWSALNLRAREEADPHYQDIVERVKNYEVEHPNPEKAPSWAIGPLADVPGRPFGKYVESQLWFGDDTILDFQERVENGDLQGDGDAKQILEDWKTRQAQLISDRYATDYLLTAGYMAGVDPAAVKKFGEDNPDFIRASNTVIDLAAAIANPFGKAVRGVVKPNLRTGSVSAVLKSGRALKKIERGGDYTYSGNIGRGASYLMDESALRNPSGQVVQPSISSRLWHLSTGKTKQILKSDSEIVQNVASQATDAIQRGDYGAVGNILKGAPDSFVNDLINKHVNYQPPRATAGMVNPPVGHTTTAVTRADVVRSVAKDITARQNAHGDAISRDVFQRQWTRGVAQGYADGLDIMPYLRFNKLAPPHRLLEAFSDHITDIGNPWLREFMTKWTANQFVRAPTVEVDWKGPGALNRVYAAAITISQDAAWAEAYRNRFVSARTTGQFKRLAEELDAKFSEKFYTPDVGQSFLPGKGQSWWQRRISNMLNLEAETGGQALAPRVEPARPGEFVTTYRSGEQIRQAVPDTVYQKYMMTLHRSALWAPYRLPDHAGLLADALLGDTLGSVASKAWVGGKNVYRVGLQTTHAASRFARQLTVAAGAPLLFQKHALTDSFRTAMEETPFSLLESIGWKTRTVKGRTIVPQVRSHLMKRYDRALSELSPYERDVTLASESRGHNSEAQYYSGKYRTRWKAKTIRDDNGHIRDLPESAAALRRITQGRGYKAYAEGGEIGVRQWLDSREGLRFLVEGDWTNMARRAMEDAGISPRGRNKEVYERAKEEYVQSMVHNQWEPLDGALPNITPTLKEMALNDQMLSDAAIAKLIQENPHDNAILSEPATEFGQQGYLGYITGKAMAANKWNRDIVFRRTFVTQYEKLKKAGVEPNMAAKTASTIAELNVARIHFDLANALAFETRHRWAAWFATKHRLYATYIGKLAVERPMIAGAALEIADWMEERNKEKDIGEFDKYDLVIDAWGGQIRLNLAPLMWFADYPLESSMMNLIEQGASWVANETTNTDWLHPSPTPFGMQFTRIDPLVLTVIDLYKSRSVNSEDTLQDWLSALPQGKRERWNRLINHERAKSIDAGWPVDTVEAFNRARVGAWWSEMTAAFKFYSGRFVGAEDIDVDKKLNDFSKLAQTDQEAAQEMIRNDPVLAACLNASGDPVEKAQIDDGFRLFNQMKDDIQLKLEEAYNRNTLTVEYPKLLKEWQTSIDKLTNPAYLDTYNEAFAKIFSQTNPKAFLDALGVVLPLIPADSVWRAGRAKTADQINEYKQTTLMAPFQRELDKFGIPDTDHSSLLYQILQYEMIERPVMEWSGEDPNALVPHTAETVARYLARGGKTGPFKADKFLELVTDASRRELAGKGITNGTPTTPVMGLLTPEQKTAIFYNSNPATFAKWKQYAIREWIMKKYRNDHGISPSSTIGKKLKAEVIAYGAQLAKGDVDFALEWSFSKLRFHQRLETMGVGSGDTKLDEGYRDFLAICDNYWHDLDTTYNKTLKKNGVSPSAQAAYPVAMKHLPKIAALAKKNAVWWVNFRNSFTVAKFGFKWWSPGDIDDFLRSGKWRDVTKQIEQAQAEAEYEEMWW